MGGEGGVGAFPCLAGDGSLHQLGRRGFGGFGAPAVVGGVARLAAQHTAGRLSAEGAVFGAGTIRRWVVAQALDAPGFAMAILCRVAVELAFMALRHVAIFVGPLYFEAGESTDCGDGEDGMVTLCGSARSDHHVEGFTVFAVHPMDV